MGQPDLRTAPGGWPHGAREEDLEPPAELEDDQAVVGVMMARRSLTQVVLVVVVVSTEPYRTREQLGVHYLSR